MDCPEAGHLSPALVSICDTLVIYAILRATLSPACFSPDWLLLDPLGRPYLVQVECYLYRQCRQLPQPWPAVIWDQCGFTSRPGPRSLPVCPQMTGGKESVWPVRPAHG